jgi:hypothetical protein
MSPGRKRMVQLAGLRQRAWNSMRYLGRFELGQLVATSGLDYENSQEYVRRLTGAGFLRLERPAWGNRPAVWRLVRNSGPAAPRAKERQGRWYVLDPNDQRIYGDNGEPVEGGGEA